jgi:MFS family permease
MQMQAVAVGWQVYAISQSPLDLGYVGLAIFLPFILFSLVAGDVADRFDRRKILVLCYGILTLCSGLLFWFSRAGIQSVAPIYAVLCLLGATRAFAGPAGSALLPHLVPPEVFGRAVAWSSSVWQFATIAGPALGGLVYDAGGAGQAYAWCVAFMGLAAVLTTKLDVRPRSEAKSAGDATTTVQRLAAGLRFVWNKKLVLGALSLDLFAVLFGGAVALLPIFAKDILAVDALGMGLMRSAPAVGAAVVAVWLAYFPLQRRVGLKMLLSVAIFGVATCAFALSRSFALSLAALTVIGASDMVSVVVRQTLIQLGTPDAMRGRVSAVNQVFIGASNELGEFESGVTAQWVGAVTAVVIGGVGTCLVVLLWSRLFPALREADDMAGAKAAERRAETAAIP